MCHFEKSILTEKVRSIGYEINLRKVARQKPSGLTKAQRNNGHVIGKGQEMSNYVQRTEPKVLQSASD